CGNAERNGTALWTSASLALSATWLHAQGAGRIRGRRNFAMKAAIKTMGGIRTTLGTAGLLILLLTLGTLLNSKALGARKSGVAGEPVGVAGARRKVVAPAGPGDTGRGRGGGGGGR